MVLDQAESSGVFNREDRYNTRFAYSHLWTGLGYVGIQEFLGLTPERGFKPNPVPKSGLDNLGELCLWLYGSKAQNKPPLIRSQNPDLRNLDEVLRSENGLAGLRGGLPLETAIKASRGDERLFLEAMVLAEQKIKEARGLVLTGYHGDSELLRKAESISLIAQSIYEEMEAKHASGAKGGKTQEEKQGMMDPSNPPSPNDPPDEHADFLEFLALKSRSGSVSIHEYIKELKIANADETIADSDPDNYDSDEDLDQSEPLAEAAFSEIDDRILSCGKDANHYPFELSSHSLKALQNAERHTYTFLALLSWLGKDAGPRGMNGDKLFEEVCARAAATYLGGPHHQVKWYLFGFPRRVQPKGFRAALDKLCEELGEGRGHHTARPRLPHEKDAKLDVVVWRDFHDRRQGKLITFGQCATGADWVDKVTELP